MFVQKLQFKYQFPTLFCLGACKDYFGMDLTLIIFSMDIEHFVPYQLAFCMLLYLHIKYGIFFY